MFETTYVVLAVIGAIFLILGVEYEREHDYWNVVLVGISMIMFLSLGGAVMNIEIPWVMYNASSAQIEMGVQVHGTDWMLAFLFFGIGFFESAYLIFMLLVATGKIDLESFKQKYKRR